MNAGNASIAKTELTDRPVAVIGAGIAGLVAAIALREQGARVTVYEQSAELSEAGAGIQIAPNAMRLLDRLGPGTTLRAVGVPALGVDLRAGLSGRRLLFSRFAGDYVFIHRAELIGILAKAATDAGVDVRLNAKQSADEIEADLVVAADGVHSRHRAALNPTHAPVFSRMVAYRTICQADGAEPRLARLWTGPGAHLVSYPLGDSSQVNLVGVCEVETWQGSGWSTPADLGELAAHFSRFAPEVQALIHRAGPVLRWGLFRAPVASRWQDGRVVLIGDAAHPTLPFLAQGANMGIEDGWLLAALLAKHGLQSLPQFETIRQARTSKIVAAADRNGRIYHARGLARIGLEIGIRAVSQLGLIGQPYGWVHDYDAASDVT
ncbi:MAG: FAD-dependent monooxygenase [Deltaproteobacteria bacterium]